jgi:lipopolysaccharide/colanic/teichoic acid biosynthesis glycosyltransferase
LKNALTPGEDLIKRGLDLGLAIFLLLLTWWVILLAWLAVTITTGANGFFSQSRIGRWGRPFNVLKIKTMRPIKGHSTTITTSNDPRITFLGRIFRASKIDELPQLLNVLTGDMSFVGPRPDVAGFADLLEGEDRIVLSLRPGITGPATLYFRHEERILAGVPDPDTFNRDFIFPKKVALNIIYIRDYSVMKDLGYIFRTVLEVLKPHREADREMIYPEDIEKPAQAGVANTRSTPHP